jgi:serine phosphatase RsbU (regulator of sigma subunit)
VAAVYEGEKLQGSVLAMADESEASWRAAVHAVARLAMEATDFAVVAPRILETIGHELGWACGNLWTVDSAQQSLVQAAQWQLPWRQPTTLRFGEGLPGRVWASGHPEWVSDFSTEPGFPRSAAARDQGLRAACGFPIVVEGQVLGVFELFDRQPLPPEPGLLDTLVTLSTHVGQLILRRRAQAQLESAYRREREIARRFQSSLWPRGPLQLPGYRAAFWYRPALAEADVGGDFFNLFDIDARRAGLVIGDVGGKGLQAAVTAAWFQHALTALALRRGATPASVLDDLIKLFVPLDLDCLVTVFFGILDKSSGSLVYASAGHEPALLWRSRTCTSEWLASGQPALISVPVEPYHDHAVVLEEQDLLLLYTDGLPEAGQRDRMLGEDALPELLAGCHHEPPEEILCQLCQAAQRHGTTGLLDDIAMVALRRLAPGCKSDSSAVILHQCQASCHSSVSTR